MAEQDRLRLESIATSVRLLRSYQLRFDDPNGVPKEFAVMRSVVLLGDMIADLAQLVAPLLEDLRARGRE